MPTTLSRSLLTILIPGLIAICPWLLVIVQNTPAMLGFGKYDMLANALVFCAATVVGSICERIAACLEHRLDGEREAQHKVQENWSDYLYRKVDPEPVAFRYLSRLVTHLYFELGMLCAAPSFILGSVVLAWHYVPNLCVPLAIVGQSLAVGSCCFFYTQARGTHLLLCKTREELNKRLRRAEVFSQNGLTWAVRP